MWGQPIGDLASQSGSDTVFFQSHFFGQKQGPTCTEWGCSGKGSFHWTPTLGPGSASLWVPGLLSLLQGFGVSCVAVGMLSDSSVPQVS